MIASLLDTAAYSGGRVEATAGHNLITEVDVTDVTSLLGLLPVYARAGAR